MSQELGAFVWQQLFWPPILDGDAAIGIVRRFAADRHRGRLVLEARAEHGIVDHLIATTAHQARVTTDLLGALLPGTVTSAPEEGRPGASLAVRLTLRGARLPLDTEQRATSTRAILAALAQAHFKGEALVLQVVIGQGKPGRILRAAADPTQSTLSKLAGGLEPATGETLARLRLKHAAPSVRVLVRVAVTAMSAGRRRALLEGLLAAFRSVESPGVSLDFIRTRGSLDAVPSSGWLRLGAEETLSFLAWPLDASALPGMPAAHPRQLPLIRGAATVEDAFAMTTAPGKKNPVGISPSDAVFHFHATGSTGAGKSTVLQRLIINAATQGQSIIVIDAKKDLVTDVLSSLPPERWDDVVVLDPSHQGTEDPVGLNPFAIDGVRPELIADGLLAVMKDLFPDAFGPRVSEVTHAALLSLAHRPGSTLTDLPRLLTDAVFRRRIISSLDSYLQDYWAGFDSLSDSQRAQHVAPVLSRLNQFLLRRGLRRVLDQPTPRFSLPELFSGTPRILLVPLNSGLLGKASTALMGSMLVSLAWNLTLARADLPKNQRPPVSIFVDEAQEFIRASGADLGDALARSRSLGVAWHIAHQYRTQMPREILNALDANAKSKLIMAPGPDDSRSYANIIPELTVEDFTALPPYHVYANLMQDSHSTGWFSAATLPPSKLTGDPAALTTRSLARFGGSATDTNKNAVNEGVQPVRPDVSTPGIGRRKRRQ